MLDEDPAVLLRHLLIDNWDTTNIDAPFDPRAQDGGINTGQDNEIRTTPQITIIHVGDSMTGNTGYNYITPRGPAKWVGVRMQIDAWVPDVDSWNSSGEAKRMRWQLQEEVERIIHANATGTTDDQGRRQFQKLGIISSRRSTQTDPTPVIFRASMDLRGWYERRPPQEM